MSVNLAMQAITIDRNGASNKNRSDYKNFQKLELYFDFYKVQYQEFYFQDKFIHVNIYLRLHLFSL